MQPEKELYRDYCPHCQIKVNTAFAIICGRCGSEDLIPDPTKNLLPMQQEAIKNYSTSLPSGEYISKFTGNAINIEESTPTIQVELFVKEGLKKQWAFLSGEAGTGKSTNIRLMAEADPPYIELTSTTGIAAVNLGGRTVHSTLKFFNLRSLENNYNNGKLQWELRKVRSRKRVLGIEECSMLGAQQADFIIAAIDEINNDRTGKQLGLHFIGDLAQLPVICRPPENMQMVFKSQYWDRFANNTIKLTKIWRQTNPDFIQAMNLVRKGRGEEAIKQLQKCGVQFKSEVDWNFDGTTLIPLNDKVDYYNTKRLSDLKTPMIRTVSKKFGIPLNEWDKLIPAELRVKIGAYIMILSNDIPNFRYVNGDSGFITAYDEKSDKFTIELTRNKSLVKIGRIVRENLTDRPPSFDNFKANFHPYVDPKSGEWCIGVISFHPIKLAWASTIHKVQGLTLDRVQIDTNHQFFSAPSMGYVSMSRARAPEGLILIGEPNKIAKRININKEIIPYL